MSLSVMNHAQMVEQQQLRTSASSDLLHKTQMTTDGNFSRIQLVPQGNKNAKLTTIMKEQEQSRIQLL